MSFLFFEVDVSQRVLFNSLILKYNLHLKNNCLTFKGQSICEDISINFLKYFAHKFTESPLKLQKICSSAVMCNITSGVGFSNPPSETWSIQEYEVLAVFVGASNCFSFSRLQMKPPICSKPSYFFAIFCYYL